MEIKSDVGENAASYGVFCGASKPALVTSESNTLLVEFTSDNTVQRTGFSAFFFTGMCPQAYSPVAYLSLHQLSPVIELI